MTAPYVPPAPPKRPGFLERVMPTPRGMGGLLTPEDMEAARRQGLLQFGMSLLGQSGASAAPVGLGQAVGTAFGAGQQGFQGAAAQSAQGAMMEQQQAKAQKQQALREKMRVLFQDPGMNEQQRYQAIQQFMAEAYANGDSEALGPLSQMLVAAKPKDAATQADWVDYGGYKALMDPQGNEIKRVDKTPSPKDPNAPDHAKEVSDQRMFQREQQLLDDYNKDTKSQRETSAKLVESLKDVDRARQGDGAAQVGMLYTFISAMDPASAVREGEIGLAQAATSFLDRWKGVTQKVIGGEAVVIPPAMLDQMASLMERRLGGYSRYVDERAKYYENLAKDWGVRGAGRFPRIGSSAPDAPPATAGSGNADAVRKLLKKP